VSFIGTQLSVVAVPIQVYKITGSSLAVGLLGIVQLGPLLVCSLLGGALADAFDRRRVLLGAQVCLAATSVGLALNAGAHRPALWLLYALSAAAAGLAGIDSPTRAAAIPSMVKPAELPAALALNQMLMQAGLVVGPALGGIVIAKVDIAAAYWIDVATFGVSLAAVLAMRPMVPEGGGTKAGVKSITEGLRYLKGRQALQGTFVIDINAMVFGMPRALFPELGSRVFGGGAATVGLLYAAPGAGALLGALGSGWVGRIQRQGYAVLVAVALWGAAIAGFGFSPWLWLALALLAVAGAADVISAVFRNTILQLSVPDRLRGRLSAVHIAVVAGGPRLGDTESGAVSALIGARASVVSGGLACLAGVGVIARLMPELARWRTPTLSEDPFDGAAPSGLGAAGTAAPEPEEPGITLQR
jgi:MFS family permease